MSIRPQDVLLYGGGECFQRFGVPFWRQTRAQDVVATFTRSGAVGPFIGKDGVLRSASANRLRVDWVDSDSDDAHDAPTFLLEAARTNLVGSDDLTAWSTSGTPQVTGSVTDPAGGTGAYTVEDDDGAADEYILRALTFTGNGTKSFVFVVRENTAPAGDQLLLVRDTSAAATRLQMEIASWTDGEPSITATTGTLLGKRYTGNGYWAIYAQSTSVTAANTNQVRIYPAETAAQTGSIDVYRVNAYNNDVPSASILDASEARSADTLYADFPWTPQEMTAYLKFIARTPSGIGGSRGIMRIGQSGSDPRFIIIDGSSGYRLVHDSGTNAPTTPDTLTAVSWGDTVELRAVLNADGSVTLGQSVNSGAESTAATATTETLGTAWAAERIYIGSRGGAGQQSIEQFLSVKVVRGTPTLSELRSLFAYDSDRAVL